MTVLPIGVAYPLVTNQVYALPAKAVLVASNDDYEISQNGIDWNPIFTDMNGQVVLAAMFLRAPSNGTIVSLKEGVVFVPSDGSDGSGGAELPTAPLGQVLISQGVGVPPIFSEDPSVRTFYSKYGIYITEGKIWPYTVVFNRQYLFSGIGLGEGIGELANIADSNTGTIGAIIAGGGTFNVLARWDGTNWRVVAGNGFPKSIVLYNPAGDPGARRWEIRISGDLLEIDSQSDTGVSNNRPVQISIWNGSITTPASGAFNAYTALYSEKICRISETTLALMPPTPGIGALANISDSTVNTPGATVAGGGTFHVLARFDGTIWKVIGA